MESQIVQIIIKNAFTRVEDFSVRFPLNKTVADLKQYLFENYPNRPEPLNQKIIFLGKLLKDESTLADVFKQQDVSVPLICHIVTKSGITSTSTPELPRSSFAAPPPHQTTSPQIPPRRETFPPNMAPPPPPNAYNIPPNMQPNPYFAPPPNMPPNAHYPPQHFAQPNPYYGAAAAPPPPHHQNMGPNPYYAPPNAFQNPRPQQPPPQFMPQPLRNPNRPRMNGDGGQNVYLLLKLALMVYIFSQGGTSSRTAVLAVAAFLIYLYQTGQLRIITHYQFAVVPPAVQQGQGNQGADAAAGGVGGEVPAGGEGQQGQVQTPRFINEIAGFVGPFVYSLFPTWQPGTQQQPAAPPPPVQEGFAQDGFPQDGPLH